MASLSAGTAVLPAQTGSGILCHDMVLYHGTHLQLCTHFPNRQHPAAGGKTTADHAVALPAVFPADAGFRCHSARVPAQFLVDICTAGSDVRHYFPAGNYFRSRDAGICDTSDGSAPAAVSCRPADSLCHGHCLRQPVSDRLCSLSGLEKALANLFAGGHVSAVAAVDRNSDHYGKDAENTLGYIDNKGNTAQRLCGIA